MGMGPSDRGSGWRGLENDPRPQLRSKKAFRNRRIFWSWGRSAQGRQAGKAKQHTPLTLAQQWNTGTPRPRPCSHGSAVPWSSARHPGGHHRSTRNGLLPKPVALRRPPALWGERPQMLRLTPSCLVPASLWCEHDQLRGQELLRFVKSRILPASPQSPGAARGCWGGR